MVSKFRQRLPTQNEAKLLFVACAFVVNAWSILNLLRSMPSLLGHLRISSILVVVAYTQAFALIESCLIFAALIILGFLLPHRFIRNAWVSKGTVFIFITSLWTISYHYLPSILLSWRSMLEELNYKLTLSLSEEQILIFGIGLFFLLWIIGYVFLLLWSFSQIRKSQSLSTKIPQFLERLLVLTAVYIGLDIFGGLAIILRWFTL